MAITIDWAAKVIQVPRADMLLLQSTPTEIRQLDLNSFRQTLKALEASYLGMGYLRTHTHNASVSVGGAVLAQVIQIVNGYTVLFEDGQYRVQTGGANSNIGEVTQVNQVSVSTSNSAGLQDLNSLQAASFGGLVAIDEGSIYSGITFPVGTRGFPVNNLPDAHTIADNRGINEFVYLASGTISTADISDGHTIMSDNKVKVTITVSPLANVTDTIFKNVAMSGTLDGGNVIDECNVGDINFFNGEILNSSLIGTIQLGGGISAAISSCQQSDPAIIPIIDMNGSGQDLIISNWKGGQVKIINSTGAGHHVITGDGEVIIDASCVAGIFEVYGDMKIANQGTATIINETSGRLAAEEVWAYSKALTVAKWLGYRG